MFCYALACRLAFVLVESELWVSFHFNINPAIQPTDIAKPSTQPRPALQHQNST